MQQNIFGSLNKSIINSGWNALILREFMRFIYMQNSKKFMLFLICFINLRLLAFEINDLNGVWDDTYTYNFLISEKKISNFFEEPFRWGNGKSLTNTGFKIDVLANSYDQDSNALPFQNCNDCNYDGYYWDGNYANINVSQYSNNIFYLECFRNFEEEEIYLGRTIIAFIDKDLIRISGWTFGMGPIYEHTWHRISGPAKIPPQNAIINDTRVRLRTKPNLESDTWGYLNTGDRVVIKDKTDEKFTIDGDSWYWYKVDAEGYPDGWVYGKYMDVE